MALRTRLLVTFLLLVVVTGGGTLLAIARTLAKDLVSALDERLTSQGKEIAKSLAAAGHPERQALRLAAASGARITVVESDGLVIADSGDPAAIGQPVGAAPEVSRARRTGSGRAIRQLGGDGALQFLVAIHTDTGRVVRLSVPVDDVIATRARMRNRLLVGGALGLLGCLVLSWIFIRAVTRPLQLMTRAAEKLAAGDYDVPALPPADGELGVLAGAMARMTAEVKARVDELTQQRDLLAGVFRGLVEGVVVIDAAGGVALVNEAARVHLDAGGALPQPLAPLVRDALAGTPREAELELAGRAVRASAVPLSDPGAIVVLYDVTRMRALEAVRREFLSNAAHELRTPVTSIAGYAETLLGGGVDPDTAREFLQTIHRNAGRIAALVSDLVLLDTLGGRAAAVVTRVAVPLAQVVHDAARTARGVTPDAQIDIAVAPELAVLATREGLDHIVQNLIDNAIKYGGGTPIAVSAAVVEPPGPAAGERGAPPPRAQGRAATEPPVRGGRARLWIADRGPGIPPGHEERIFERFYRIDSGRSRDRGGSGLGLAIVRGQAEAMGGRVWVEDAAPGARFVVELELAP
jgi:two-component system phosphate regulon sensor histidine kinase PhoR